jgi:hypothetical protein
LTQRPCHQGGGPRCRCERPGHGSSVGHQAGGPLAVGEALGRAVGRGLDEPTRVEDEACGRGADPRGSGVKSAGLEACEDDADGAATGGGPAPGLFPDEPPGSASVRPVTAATSTAAPATIKRTPWRNLISSSRA